MTPEPNCLVNATFLPHQRTNVIFNGTSMPLMVSYYSWDSSRILSEIYMILVREVLGKNTDVARVFGTSKKGYRAISGCQNPEAGSEADAQCGVPGPQQEHVLIECWDSYASSAMNYIRANYVDQSPIAQGECGFPGRDSMFVPDAALEPALRLNHLPLEYYYSYSNPFVDASQFFDSPWSIDTSYLRLCNETGLSGFAEKYYQLFNDNQGVIVSTDGNGQTTYTANCDSPYPHWWLSPACRRDTTKCIPWISADYGWFADAMMHRAAAWNIPIAIATGKQYSDYTTVPKLYRTQFYWWFPDTAFITRIPKELIWPPYDKGEWQGGNMRTDNSLGKTRKWSYFGLAERGNDGFSQALALLSKMQVGYQEIYGILQDVVNRSVNTPESRRQYACGWLNANVNVWMQWKPEGTQCIEGRGLVNRAGSYVHDRDGNFDPSLNKANAGAATGCEWCQPGNFSERLSDSIGITHRCTKCPDGLYQADLGMTSCATCGLGQVPAPDKSSCVSCPRGTYASVKGLVTCTPCPAGFTSSVLGATDFSACICEEGRYRLIGDRGVCEVCPRGMSCAEGSDELNFGSLHDQDPVANPAPVVKAGYWASRTEPVRVFACDSIERCPGGPPGRACSAYLEGQACGMCADGYSWAGDRCKECHGKALSIFIFPVIPLLVTPMVICILYKFGGDTYSKWGSWQNGVTSMLFVLLNHYQVVSILSGVNVLFPHHLVQLLRVFTFTTDLLGIFNPACSGLRDFKHIFILRCLAPLILAALYLITFGVSRLIGRGKLSVVKMDLDRTLNGYFSLILTFFIALSESCFAIFKCAPNPNDTESLLVDRSITCQSDDWQSLVIGGSAALVIWIGGFGALFVRVILVSAKNFHDPGIQMRWKFLFIRYRPDVHYWAISFVIRGILLNLGFTFIRDGLGQILWLLGVLSVYTGAMFLFRPWRHMMNNFMDLWAHLNLCMACSSTIWFTNLAGPEYADANLDRQATVSAFFMVVLFMILMPFFPAVSTMYWAQTSQAALTKKCNELQMIMDSFDQVASAEEDARREFLMGLDEIDFWFMGMAKDILQTEFAKRRCRTGYSDKKLDKVSLEEMRQTTLNCMEEARSSQAVERNTNMEMRFVNV